MKEENAAPPVSRDTMKRIRRHIDALGDADQNISYRAERRLIRFGPKAVDALLQAGDSPDPQVRFRAVWALGKSGDPRAFVAILRRTDDPDDRVRYDAVLALGELGDRRADAPLAALAAQQDRPDSVSGAARTALAKLQGRLPNEEE